jgi:6-phosphogluconolactonase
VADAVSDGGAGGRFGAVQGEVRVVEDVPGAFAEIVAEAFATRPGSPFSTFTLGCSGGSLARRCYERLAEEAAASVDWALVEVVMSDERCVAPDDPDANQRLVREALLDGVAEVAAFRPLSCEAGAEAGAAMVAGIDRLDVLHLGLGPDGHAASLFPDSPALDAPASDLVVLSEDPHGRNPHRRITFTYSAIARAELAVVTAAGEEKADALAALAAGQDLPAARIRPKQLLWLVDPAAASKVPA